ncbi:hypothetical protein [Actinacidiphila oryziradicis]|uniref:hypothetical protein n=1 Tax=Actinacidiphila oryziradicis TaxID=2571141 RepID=UPI00145EDF8B|nr:hypothetical protein [Actinacidiphila oryziradicis]
MIRPSAYRGLAGRGSFRPWAWNVDLFDDGSGLGGVTDPAGCDGQGQRPQA